MCPVLNLAWFIYRIGQNIRNTSQCNAVQLNSATNYSLQKDCLSKIKTEHCRFHEGFIVGLLYQTTLMMWNSSSLLQEHFGFDSTDGNVMDRGKAVCLCKISPPYSNITTTTKLTSAVSLSQVAAEAPQMNKTTSILKFNSVLGCVCCLWNNLNKLHKSSHSFRFFSFHFLQNDCVIT